MGITRRSVLGAMGAGAVWSMVPATGLGLVGSGAQVLVAATSSPFDWATATAATFGPHVGSRFRLTRPGQKPLDLRLDGVVEAPPDGLTDTFSLQFTAPRSAGLGQATYTLDHAVLGTFRIFMVPAGPQGLGAVVNHVAA